MVWRNTNPDRYKYKRCVFYRVDKGFSERVRLISVVNCWQVCLDNFKLRFLVFIERFCWVAWSRWKVLMRDDGWETPCLKLRFIPLPYFHRHRHKYKWKYKYKYRNTNTGHCQICLQRQIQLSSLTNTSVQQDWWCPVFNWHQSHTSQIPIERRVRLFDGSKEKEKRRELGRVERSPGEKVQFSFRCWSTMRNPIGDCGAADWKSWEVWKQCERRRP